MAFGWVVRKVSGFEQKGRQTKAKVQDNWRLGSYVKTWKKYENKYKCGMLNIVNIVLCWQRFLNSNESGELDKKTECPDWLSKAMEKQGSPL